MITNFTARHIVETEAPDNVVVGLRHVKLGVAILIVAMALATAGFAAAVAIGDQIGLVVVGIDAGADPRGGRSRGPCRAGVGTAAATGAQIAVDAAIAPVIALGVVLGLGIHGEMGARPLATVGFALGMRPADRQHGKYRRRRQRQPRGRQPGGGGAADDQLARGEVGKVGVPVMHKGDMATLFELLRAGAIHPLVVDRLPLAAAGAVHARIDKGGVGGKIVLLPWS